MCASLFQPSHSPSCSAAPYLSSCSLSCMHSEVVVWIYMYVYGNIDVWEYGRVYENMDVWVYRNMEYEYECMHV